MSVWRPAGLRCFINLAAAAAGLLQTDNTMYSYIRVHRLGEHFHTEYNRHMSITDPLWPTSTYTFPHNFPVDGKLPTCCGLVKAKIHYSLHQFHVVSQIPLQRLVANKLATSPSTDKLRGNVCNGFWALRICNGPATAKLVQWILALKTLSGNWGCGSTPDPPNNSNSYVTW